MQLQLSFSDINIRNNSHLQFHEVIKYKESHSSFFKKINVNHKIRRCEALLFMTSWICIPVNEIYVNHFETMQVNKTF